MPATLTPYYEQELADYRAEMAKGNWQKAFRHLERAHIIGQAYPVAHTQVHWKMLRFGFKIKSGREIMGQIPRLLIGGVKSFVGQIPVGNTGGANVPPLQPMPIPADLQSILDQNR